MSAHVTGLLGILIALSLLIFLAFRGYTLLLMAAVTAMVTPAFSGELILAKLAADFYEEHGRLYREFQSALFARRGVWQVHG